MLLITKIQFAPIRQALEFIGDPCRIRTCDLLLRRQLLYPAELRDQINIGSEDPSASTEFCDRS